MLDILPAAGRGTPAAARRAVTAITVLLLFALVAKAPPAAAAPAIQPGAFLVADKSLNDPNFRRSVVLVLHHDATGTIGLIVNRSAHFAPGELLPGVAGLDEYRSPMFVGGPVGLTQVSVLSSSDEVGERLIDGVYLSNDPKSLARLVASGHREASTLRIFLGYAGWSPGQLAREIRTGAWHVRPATAGEVFERPDRLWESLNQAPSRGRLLRVEGQVERREGAALASGGGRDRSRVAAR